MIDTIVCAGSNEQVSILINEHQLWLSINIGAENLEGINQGRIKYLSIYNTGTITHLYEITATMPIINDSKKYGEHAGKHIVFLKKEIVKEFSIPFQEVVQGRIYKDSGELIKNGEIIGEMQSGI